MVAGSDVPGYMAVYNGSTELGSRVVEGKALGGYLNIPLTTKATQALATTDVVTIKVKTAGTGAAPAESGTIKGYFTVAYDPRETTAVNFGYYHGAA